MAGNLTGQVRNIAYVTKAVAPATSRKSPVDVKGEFLELEKHRQHHGGSAPRVRIRSNRVAREVAPKENWRPGQCARCGRHMERPHHNVNFMASNLTDPGAQYPTVTTAVANGDLSKKITGTCAAKSSNIKTPSTRWWTN